MSIKSIIKEVIRTVTFWIPTNNPPNWVIKASSSVVVRASHRPVDRRGRSIYFKKYLRGKNNLYKIIAQNSGQGTADVKYYWKPKI